MTAKKVNTNDLILIGTAEMIVDKNLSEGGTDEEIDNVIKAIGSLTLSRDESRNILETYIANSLNRTKEGELI